MTPKIEVWQRGDTIKLVCGDKSMDVPASAVPKLIEELKDCTGFVAPPGQHWNDLDIQKLKNLHAERMRAADIARILGRDVKAVQNKLHTLKKEGKR